jgi:selT/selW/selH-like putative selenoprotein
VEAELKANYSDADVKLIKGHGGIFEVKCNGKLIFTKKTVARFPNDGEIAALVKKESG